MPRHALIRRRAAAGLVLTSKEAEHPRGLLRSGQGWGGRGCTRAREIRACPTPDASRNLRQLYLALDARVLLNGQPPSDNVSLYHRRIAQLDPPGRADIALHKAVDHH